MLVLRSLFCSLVSITIPQLFCEQNWNGNSYVVLCMGTFCTCDLIIHRVLGRQQSSCEVADNTVKLPTCSDTGQLCGPGSSPWCLHLKVKKMSLMCPRVDQEQVIAVATTLEF